MDRRNLLMAALMALLMPLGTAQASDDLVSELALPLFEPEAPVLGPAETDLSQFAARYEPRKAPATQPAAQSSPQATETKIVPAPPRYHVARYEPRRSRSRHSSRGSSGWGGSTQIHGGFFNFDDAQGTSGLFGFRAGPRFGQHLSIGVGTDWQWQSENISEVVGEGSSVGGQPVVIHQEIARATSHLVPVMGYMEMSAGSSLPISPYVGAGGGYQWLFLSGEDYVTLERYDATFGNWGWQAWAGLTLRLSPTVRLNGEAFYNNATLNRDSRLADGTVIRESVDANGIGGRFGLSFGLF